MNFDINSKVVSFSTLSLSEILRYARDIQKPKSKMTLQEILELHNAQSLSKISRIPTLKETLDLVSELSPFDIQRLTKNHGIESFFSSHVLQYQLYKESRINLKKLAITNKNQLKSHYFSHIKIFELTASRLEILGVTINPTTNRMEIKRSDYHRFETTTRHGKKLFCPICLDDKGYIRTVCKKCFEILDII